MTQLHHYDGWSYEKLRSQRNRAHFLLEDPFRFVTVILLEQPKYLELTQQQQQQLEECEQEGVQEAELSLETQNTEIATNCRRSVKRDAHTENSNRKSTCVHSRLVCIDSACYHAAGPLGEGVVKDIEDIQCVECPWHKYLISLDDGCEVFVEEQEEDGKQINAISLEEEELSIEANTSASTLESKHKNKCKVTKGKRVQRTHSAYLNELTGVLTIAVADAKEIKSHPLPSDGPTTRLREGALCMQIFDIKQKGLDKM